MSARAAPQSDPAAVLARHRAPAGRRQRDLPAAHRRATGRIRHRGHAAHRALSGCRRGARSSTGSGSAAAGGRYSVYIWAALAMARGQHRARSAARGATRRGHRHPERAAVPCPAGLRPTRRRAGAPLPPRAVAGGRAASIGPHRLVRRVAAVAAAAPAQPVRHGVAAVGARSGRPRRGRRPDRHGPQRSRQGARHDPGPPRSAMPRVVVLSRLVPHKQIEDALEAIARPALPRYPICTSTSSAAVGGAAARRPRRRGSASPTR